MSEPKCTCPTHSDNTAIAHAKSCGIWTELQKCPDCEVPMSAALRCENENCDLYLPKPETQAVPREFWLIDNTDNSGLTVSTTPQYGVNVIHTIKYSAYERLEVARTKYATKASELRKENETLRRELARAVTALEFVETQTQQSESSVGVVIWERVCQALADIRGEK